MKKLFLTAIVTGASLLAVAAPNAYEGGLKPLLKEVKINGQVLYSDDMKETKTVDVKTDKPMTVEYTFVNKGDAPSVGIGKVFVHFMKGDKIARGGDFSPSMPTDKWKKDFVFKQTLKYDMKALKGAKTEMYVGLYFYKEKKSPRINFVNKMASGQRVKVGDINFQ